MENDDMSRFIRDEMTEEEKKKYIAELEESMRNLTVDDIKAACDRILSLTKDAK